MSEPGRTIDWPRVAVAAYGPTLLVSIGAGGILPLVALSARDMGAGVGMSALIVALVGLGQLVGDLPAGSLASRFGEKKALVGASLVDCVALALAWRAPNLVALGVAVFLSGLANAVFGLARQAYLTEAVPLRQRARAMSTLGGVFRVGFFLGPLIAAAVIGRYGLAAAYAVASAMSLAAAGFTLLLPDMGGQAGDATASPVGSRPMARVIREHAKALGTLGIGCLILMLGRAARFSLVPLWADAHQVNAQTVSLIMAASALADIVLFYPSGAVMDRYGRFWAAVPTLVVLGIAFGALALTRTPWQIGAVAVVLGLGNGFSAGIVLTLGSDCSPTLGRPQFLAAWRLLADLGTATGPLLITGVVAILPLSGAAVTTSVICLAGAGWFGRWLPAGRGPAIPR